MPPDPDKIKLVKALLARSKRSTFPAEADTARSKAAQLMARHGISLADLDPRVHSRAGYRDATRVYVRGPDGEFVEVEGMMVTFTVNWDGSVSTTGG